MINKYFNDFENNFNCRLIKIIFLIQNWFHSKYIKEMEIMGIMLWSKQFLDTISDNDKNLLKHILYTITAYNIIDICFSKVLNMI